MRISAWTAHLDNARTGQAVPFSRLNRSVKNTGMSHKTGNINRLFRLFHLVPELFQTKNIDFMSVWSNSGTTEQELLYRLNFISIYIYINTVCVRMRDARIGVFVFTCSTNAEKMLEIKEFRRNNPMEQV